MFFLYFLIFFNGRLSNTCSSEANGAIFTNISGLVDGCKGLFISLNFFLIFQGTLPWQPITFEKSAFFPDQYTLWCCHLEKDCNIAILISKMFNTCRMNFSTLCTILMSFAPETSVYAVNNSTFCGDTAKIGISRKISRNILDLSWPTLQVCTVGILVGMIIQIFVWWLPKGRCYGNQLNMGDVRKRRVERTFTLCFGIW